MVIILETISLLIAWFLTIAFTLTITDGRKKLRKRK
jgi:hypothetical protein